MLWYNLKLKNVNYLYVNWVQNSDISHHHIFMLSHFNRKCIKSCKNNGKVCSKCPKKWRPKLFFLFPLKNPSIRFQCIGNISWKCQSAYNPMCWAANRIISVSKKRGYKHSNKCQCCQSTNFIRIVVYAHFFIILMYFWRKQKIIYICERNRESNWR